MVSVDGFRYINHHSGIGRTFPSTFYPHFSSLFDEDDVILQNLHKGKDMKIGSSMLDSVFPFYSDIRLGRYKSYDLSSPLSHVTSDINHPSEPSGNVRVIPIKVEHRPEKYQGQSTTFRLLNGPMKHTTAGNDSLLCPGHSFQEFDDISSLDPPGGMSYPKGNNKYVGKDPNEELKSPKSYENYKSIADTDGNTYYNSKHCFPLSTFQRDSCEEQLENWTTVPVKLVESSLSDEELNSNNNSSRRRFSSAPRSQTSIKVKLNRENSNDRNTQLQNSRSRKTNPAHRTSASSEQNKSRNPRNHKSASSEQNQSRNPSYHISASSEQNESRNPPHRTSDSSEQNESRNEEVNNTSSANDVYFEIPEIEHEGIVSPPNRKEYRDLKVLLAEEDRQIDYIEGDGNCLFRALSKGNFGSEKFHKEMRMLIVNLIALNTSEFEQFVDHEDVEKHIKRMSEDGCWATTCEIYAAATLLQRDIFMLTPDHRNEKYSWLLFHPLFEKDESLGVDNYHPCYLTLCNTSGIHYDRIVADHGGCNCFLPHPELDGLLTDSTTSMNTNSAEDVPAKH